MNRDDDDFTIRPGGVMAVASVLGLGVAFTGVAEVWSAAPWTRHGGWPALLDAAVVVTGLACGGFALRLQRLQGLEREMAGVPCPSRRRRECKAGRSGRKAAR